MLETRRLLTAPVSNNDIYTVNEDTLLQTLSPGVLANDSDADADPISASLVTAPANGSLTLDSSGAFQYLPQSNFFGTDTFTYKVFDGTSFSNVSTVVITVNPVNDAPVAVNDTFSVNEDSTLTLPSVAKGQLTMTSDVGDFIGQGLSYDFSTPTASFAVRKNFSNGVSIDVGVSGQFWSLSFAAPSNALISPGFYGGAVRWPFQSGNQPGLSVSGNSRGSNTLTGEFTVNDIEYGPNNSVLQFVATFVQHSEGGIPALRGSINYNSAVPTNGSLLSNDSDVELNSLRSVLVAGPANGSVALNTNGTFTYTPKLDFSGVDTFTYQAFDGTDFSNIATVTVNVNPVNDAPYVDAASITTNEDQAYNGTIVARDPEGDSYTVTLATGPSHGITNVNSNGTYTYTPATNFYGQDSFIVRATDSNGASRLGTVSVRILPVNDAPVAQNDNFSVDEDSTLSLPSIVVSRLTMKSDPGDYIGQGATYDLNAPLAFFSVTNFPGNSVFFHVGQNPNQDWTLVFAGPQGVKMTPGPYLNATRWPFQDPNSPGLSVFGNSRGTNSLTGEFNVNEIEYDSNDVISRFSASFVQRGDSTTPNAALTGSIVYNSAIPVDRSVLSNDTDAEQNVLKSVLLSGPTNGSLSLNANGTLVYTPNPNFAGTDSFTYKANDGQLDSNVATVTLTVNPINDAPDAIDDLATTNEDVAVVISVLSNDTDIDSLLTIISATGPTTINANGTITYTPPANFNGLATFSYTVSDGNGGSDTATVTVNVAAVNDNPDAVDDRAFTNEDTAITIAVLANDTDIDGNSLTIISATGPTTINADGTVTYTPTANFNGLATFSYTVSDGNGGADTATVTVTVAAVNDNPDAVDDRVNTNEDTAITIAVLANDTDIDGNSLTITSATGPTTINANGTITYTPPANFNGPATFSYTVSDGNGGADTATVTVTVAAVNDNPDAIDDRVTTNEDTAITIAVLANDTDIDGNSLTIISATGPTKINANGTITYTPLSNFNGLATFSYTVSDGNGGSDTALVTLTILAVNDAPVALNDNASTLLNVPVTIKVLSNDTDVDGDTLKVVSATGPTKINVSGTITFTPTVNFVGITSFVYTISDGKGGTATATATVDVRPNTGVTLVNGTLLIQGTNQADNVSIKALSSTTVRVSASFLSAGFADFRTNSIQMILAHLYDGNDIIDYSGAMTIPAILDGGNGNDQIKGGAGRDLIIGGQGADVLFGFQNDDLIISGTTIYDNNDLALSALLNEWNSGRSFNSRVSNIRNGSGPFLSSQSIRLRKGLTVFDDADVDQVFGGSGNNDWIFFDPTKDSREAGDLEN